MKFFVVDMGPFDGGVQREIVHDGHIQVSCEKTLFHVGAKAVEDGKIHIRVGLTKFSKEGEDDIVAKVDGESYGDGSLKSILLGIEFEKGVFDPEQGFQGFEVELFAIIRWDQTVFEAVEKPHLQDLFEMFDMLADPRLGEEEFVGRFGHGAVFIDTFKNSKMVEVDFIDKHGQDGLTTAFPLTGFLWG